MLSCREIAKILSSKEELSLIKRTELRMHLLMCKHCSNYNKQLNLMKESFQNLFKKKSTIEKEKVVKLENDIIKKHVKSSK